MSTQGLSYWLRWQVPVCGSIILTFFAVSIYTVKNVKADAVYLHDLWRPQWRNLNPLWLLCYRIFAFSCLCPLLYQTVASHGAFVFYFYTQWTFALVMVYFAISSAISAHGCWISTTQTLLVEDKETVEFLRRETEEIGTANSITYRRNKERGTIKLQSHCEEAVRLRAGFWGYLMQIVYQTSAGAAILTDLVFWCILVPMENPELDMLLSCMHSLNAVFLLLDTALNSMPFPLFRFAYFVIWSSVYIVFLWVIHACGITWWPYPFLELAHSEAPYWYLALSVVHIPCYGVYALIVKAKNSLFSKWFPSAFVSPY